MQRTRTFVFSLELRNCWAVPPPPSPNQILFSLSNCNRSFIDRRNYLFSEHKPSIFVNANPVLDLLIFVNANLDIREAKHIEKAREFTRVIHGILKRMRIVYS
ncbi:hypothetical protein L2E82_08087 [Cichorium intybus]|uniref:Uncharacterized protein n=1 Tax=Cichorium intybus TaxID=13427 RepID=A0ACB9G502_CICIN|nr:hypothetical protein L2E82_08087 [Cichorium intybus]